MMGSMMMICMCYSASVVLFACSPSIWKQWAFVLCFNGLCSCVCVASGFRHAVNNNNSTVLALHGAIDRLEAKRWP